MPSPRHLPRFTGALFSAIAGAVLLSPGAAAEVPTTWSFDVETTGEDVFWTSPTSVTPDAAVYEGFFELTLVEVDVSWQGFPFTGIDVTDEVPEEESSFGDSVDGPAPLVLADGAFVFPEPPEPPTIAANLRVELDADGFGLLDVTNVTLGTATIDLGGFIGTQTVTITRVRIAGDLTVTPIGTVDPEPDPDLNGDGVVNVFDLLILLDQWGACPPDRECPADLTGNGAVDVFDLLTLLDAWG